MEGEPQRFVRNSWVSGVFEPSDSYKKDFYLKNSVIKGDTIIKDVKRTVKVFNTVFFQIK